MAQHLAEATEILIDPEAVRRVRDHQLSPAITSDVAAVFKAMADPTRVRILHALTHAELCVSDIAAALGMKEPAISHQLRLLRSLRVVRSRRDGKLVYYALDDEHVALLFQLSLEHLGHS
ncbi:helix-turn-helix transcriptional regulator [Chloroflexia bacterium SDU3-3]|nr:helix-turn-helix transcriptional regulator [Chloroflexia bacterium SDU3-3]